MEGKALNSDIIDALKQFEKEREIPLEVICEAIEEALTSTYRRTYASSQEASVVINRVTGEIDAKAPKTVVEDVRRPMIEISLEHAREINPDAMIGDEITVVITPDDFSRIAAQTAKQVIVQRLRESERDMMFREFSKREESLVTCSVEKIEQKNYYTELGKLEGVLPVDQQVPGEHFKLGDRFKAIILKAQRIIGKDPQVVLSRISSDFVAKLFEYEVPEISSKTIIIHGVAREPGNRTKIAVESRDPRVDPVGACVGPKGSRVQNIVEELRNEKIDIVTWSPDPAVFIANSLNPAKVIKVIPDANMQTALVIVPDSQLSLAIGKEGQNVRLAVKLTDWKIDIKNESYYLEHKEEIDSMAFEKAKKMAEDEASSSEFSEESSEELFELDGQETEIFTDSYYEEASSSEEPMDRQPAVESEKPKRGRKGRRTDGASGADQKRGRKPVRRGRFDSGDDYAGYQW